MRATEVERAEAEALLHDLVSITSPSGRETEAAQFLVAWMARHGFEAEVDSSGSAVGVRGKGQRQIVLLGHIDTFPGRLPVRREGGQLYGRGTVDAKGALSAFTAAVACLEPPSDVRLIVIGASEEEAASSRGAHYALSRYRPEACIIGEPSGWDRLTLGYKGRLLMDWRWQGPLAHSAGPVLSPAEHAVACWRTVSTIAEAVNVGRGAAFDRLDAALRSLNTTRRGAHGYVRMEIILRLPPDLRPQEIEVRLRREANGGDFRFRGHESAYVAPKNTPLSRAFLAAIRNEGGRPRFVHKTGTSDMNVVGPGWGCPILAYGPGDSRLDHTPDEHLDLDEYHWSIAVLRSALCSLMAAGTEGHEASDKDGGPGLDSAGYRHGGT